jgi:long-chain fatty acid transport protein
MLSLLVAQSAWASGFIISSTGAKAGGMAGAWVAQGDDGNVLDYNPAQMVRQTRPSLELQYTAYLFEASFAAAPVAGYGGAPLSENSADFVNHIPNFFYVHPYKQWRFGAGLFTPIGPRNTYNDSGAQRYQVEQAIQQLAWPTLSVAYQFNDKWAASRSADIAYVDVMQKMGLGLVPGFHSLDGSLTLKAMTIQTPRPKLGVLWTPNDKWSFGLVALPGKDVEVKGTIEADVPQAGLDPKTAVDDVTAGQRFPTEARMGFGYRYKQYRSELTLKYFRWSEYTEQKIDLKKNKIGSFDVADLTIPKYYQDTFTVQLGGGYALNEQHEVRAGYAFDSQAPLDKGLTIQDFDAPKHIIALGYGYKLSDRWSFNGAWNTILYQDKNVVTSETEPITVIGTPPRLGNGTYHWRVNTFAVNTEVRF